MSTQPTAHESKYKWLVWYAKRKMPIFPCGPDKKPLTAHGFKDASLDLNQLSMWHDQHPGATWGTPTGEATNLVVIDIDAKTKKHNSDGFATWEQLREEHSDPIQTVTVKTGGGGRQLYFSYPAGYVVKNGTNVLGPGIDVRGQGGYVIIPPSITDNPYTFELSPADTEIQKLPDWIFEKIAEVPSAKKAPIDDPQDYKDFAAALTALNALSPDRVNNYQSWLNVGMSLYELGRPGLDLWDGWSKQAADKYKPGECAKKWNTFNKDLTNANQITLASLFHWAKEDGGGKFVHPAKKGASPAEYAQAMEDLGFIFTLNDMNDLVYVNGQPINDILNAVIEYQLRSKNYRSEKDTKITIYKTAYDKKFHPIKDYLDSLILDGSQDHIGRLAGFFQDKDGTFKLLLTKWLLGAIGRINGDRPGQQHPMLVLDGPQGIGKSRLVSWIGSVLPAFYIQSSINTEDKDFLINLCSKWVWEVEAVSYTHLTLPTSDLV